MYLSNNFLIFFQFKIKENRRAGEISAGPQSQILEGVTWDEARQVQVKLIYIKTFSIKL